VDWKRLRYGCCVTAIPPLTFVACGARTDLFVEPSPTPDGDAPGIASGGSSGATAGEPGSSSGGRGAGSGGVGSAGSGIDAASVCPPPTTVQPGANCFLPEGTVCDGTETYTTYCISGPPAVAYQTIRCRCYGSWSCSVPPPMMPPLCAPEDAGPPTDARPPCPDPMSLTQDMPCARASWDQQCPGNSMVCDGTVVYDSLQCDDVSGVWVTVALAGCGPASDASPRDADKPLE
jgi:hypothetical protein